METLSQEQMYLGTAFAEVHQQLCSRGYASVDEDELMASTNQWRKLARDVAAELGRPVRSIMAKGRLYAVLIDWPQANEVCAYPPFTRQATNGKEFLQQLTRPGPIIGRPL